MLIYAIEISGTPSSGTYSFNTQKFNAAILKQVILKATSNDTTFDFKITDNRNNNPIDTSISGESATGIMNKQLEIPLKGICTIAIINASADEAFTGRLMIIEEN